jgi:flavin-dependent dehydrogenase
VLASKARAHLASTVWKRALSHAVGAAARDWDAVVVGAGPAGSLTAHQLRRAGLSVLLVDRQSFPRRKVCGACLSSGAQQILAEVGLEGVIRRLDPVPLQSLHLCGWGKTAHLPLDGAAALSRSALDQALVGAAVECGAVFLQGARARIGQAGETNRRVSLRLQGTTLEVRARVVVAADGLGGGLLADARGPHGQGVSPTSRVGLGAVFREAPESYAPGVIYMAIGEAGYVGLVRQEDGHLNVAAALDPSILRASTPQCEVAALLRQAGLQCLGESPSTPWQGTPALTRTPPVPGAERVLSVGDSAGYVEPFTGEGICWALDSARAVVPFAVQAAEAWDGELLPSWQECRLRRLAPALQLCRAVSWTLRQPALTRSTLRLLGAFPAVASPFLRRAAQPPALH